MSRGRVLTDEQGDEHDKDHSESQHGDQGTFAAMSAAQRDQLRSQLHRNARFNSWAAYLLGLTLRAKRLAPSLGGWADSCIKEDMAKAPGVYPHELRVGYGFLSVCLMKLVVVTDSAYFGRVFQITYRSQFWLTTALLKAPGTVPFIDKPLVGKYRTDKMQFHKILTEGHPNLQSNVTQCFKAIIKDEEQWENTSLSNMMAKFVYRVLAKTYFGIDEHKIDEVFDRLHPLLQKFDIVFQNPDRLDPDEMYQILQELDEISAELQKDRGDGPLLDDFEKTGRGPINITAVFAVGANIIQGLVHAIIRGYDLKSKVPGKPGTEEFYRNWTRLCLTERFQNTRIWRLITDFLTTSASLSDWISNLVGKKKETGFPITPRMAVVIPQGELNSERLVTGSYLEQIGDDGDKKFRVKRPHLFGQGRPCPGEDTVYVILAGVLMYMDGQQQEEGQLLEFGIDAAARAIYTNFIKGLGNTSGGRNDSSPEINGTWQKKADDAELVDSPFLLVSFAT